MALPPHVYFDSTQTVTAAAYAHVIAENEELRHRIAGLEGEDGWEPSRWWRSTYTQPDGTEGVWAESSDEQEIRRLLTEAPGGGKLYRLYRRAEQEWREETR